MSRRARLSQSTSASSLVQTSVIGLRARAYAGARDEFAILTAVLGFGLPIQTAATAG